MGLRDVWRRAIGARRAASRPATSRRPHRPPMVPEGSLTGTQRTVSVSAEAVDWTVVNRVTVELRHSDPAAGFVTEVQLVFSAGGPSSQVWQFTVGDNAPVAYAWKATYTAPDGSLFTSQEQTTADDVLLLPPTATGADVRR